MKKLYIFILAICATYNAIAQAPDIEWQKSYGGSSLDMGHEVQQTSDGGFIVVGITASDNGDITGHHGGHDIWAVKLDVSGNKEWEKALGGSNEDGAQNGNYGISQVSVKQTTDGGFIITGYSRSNDGDVSHNYNAQDYWIIKLNAVGAIEWQKVIGGGGSDVPSSIIQTIDGGYMVIGYSGSSSTGNGDMTCDVTGTKAWAVKLDDTGNIEWQQCFLSGGSVYPYSVEQTADNGYIVAGNSYNHPDSCYGGYDAWIVKLDATGTSEWQKCFGGTDEDTFRSIVQTSDGGYIVTGNTRSNDGSVSGNHGGNDSWVVKLDNAGNTQWENLYGGTGNDFGFSIEQTNDGNYIVTGSTGSNNGDASGNHGGFDFWIFKLDDTGAILWQKCMGGSGREEAYSVQQTTDGGYIVAGYSNSSNGDVTHNQGDWDYWVVKLDSESMSTTDQQLSQFDIYPNPAKDVVNFSQKIDGELFNATGQKVMTIQDAKSVNVSGLAKGVYVLKTAEGITKKIMVK